MPIFLLCLEKFTLHCIAIAAKWLYVLMFIPYYMYSILFYLLLVVKKSYLRCHKSCVTIPTDVALVEEVLDDGVLVEHDLVHPAGDLCPVLLDHRSCRLQDVHRKRTQSLCLRHCVYEDETELFSPLLCR